MNQHTLGKACALWLGVFALLGISCKPSLAQGPTVDALQPVAQTSTPVSIATQEAPSRHEFWDRKNQALFATNVLLDATDFCVTRSNLQSGGRELNPVVRIFGKTTPGLAVNFAGEAAGLIGLSYFLHKTGHHHLERVASIVNIGASAGAVTYGLTHR